MTSSQRHKYGDMTMTKNQGLTVLALLLVFGLGAIGGVMSAQRSQSATPGPELILLDGSRTREWIPPSPEMILMEVGSVTADYVRHQNIQAFAQHLTEIGQRYEACVKEKRFECAATHRFPSRDELTPNLRP